jgi:hypothetical protein
VERKKCDFMPCNFHSAVGNPSGPRLAKTRKSVRVRFGRDERCTFTYIHISSLRKRWMGNVLVEKSERFFI